MAVPEQANYYRPVLEIVSGQPDGLRPRVMYDRIADLLEISDEDRKQVFGGKRVENVHNDRAYQAARKLEDAGLLTRPRHGLFRATQEGRQFLGSHEGPISSAQLTQLARELQQDDGNPTIVAAPEEQVQGATDEIAPAVLMEQAFLRQTADLRSDLLASVNGITPEQFEQLVVDLLVKMGYGEGEAVGRSGDGGIDGIINQDALGLEKVYVQAKRHTAGSIGSPLIQQFSGALDQQAATKGVFITTSTFSRTARQTAQDISRRNKFIRLVDGNELALLMIRHGVGVVTEYAYEIKKLDENYFAEEI